MGHELHVAREQAKSSSSAMAMSGDQQQGYSGVGLLRNPNPWLWEEGSWRGLLGALITRLPWDSATLLT